MNIAQSKRALKNLKHKLYLIDTTVFHKISTKSGITLLLGGLLLFTLWICGRYLFVCDLEILAFIGFLWVYFGFFVGIIAILLLILYKLLNLNKNHLPVLPALIIILLNIPCVILISKLQNIIENKVFILFRNESNVDNLNFDFIKSGAQSKLGNLDESESITFNYIPKFRVEDARKYQEPEDLYIKISKENSQTKLLKFSELTYGSCYKVILTENFTLKMQKRIFWEIN